MFPSEDASLCPPTPHVARWQQSRRRMCPSEDSALAPPHHPCQICPPTAWSPALPTRRHDAQHAARPRQRRQHQQYTCSAPGQQSCTALSAQPGRHRLQPAWLPSRAEAELQQLCGSLVFASAHRVDTLGPIHLGGQVCVPTMCSPEEERLCDVILPTWMTCLCEGTCNGCLLAGHEPHCAVLCSRTHDLA